MSPWAAAGPALIADCRNRCARRGAAKSSTTGRSKKSSAPPAATILSARVRRVGDDAPEREDVGGGPDLPAPGLLGRHVPALSRRSRALVRDVFAARGPGDAEVAEVHRA